MDGQLGTPTVVTFNRLLTDWLIEEYPGKEIKVGSTWYWNANSQAAPDFFRVDGQKAKSAYTDPVHTSGSMTSGRITCDTQVGGIEIGFTPYKGGAEYFWIANDDYYTSQQQKLVPADPEFFPKLKAIIDKKLENQEWME